MSTIYFKGKCVVSIVLGSMSKGKVPRFGGREGPIGFGHESRIKLGAREVMHKECESSTENGPTGVGVFGKTLHYTRPDPLPGPL